MLVTLTCAVCNQSLAAEPNSGIVPTVKVPFNSNGRYEFTCNNGHNQCVVLQNDLWEILADIAVQAIKDNYYREAVTTFNAALERFYELVFRVLMYDKVAKNNLDSTWKSVASQSERQIGLYLSSYLAAFDSVPPMLPLNNPLGSVKFRNQVVHKGHIPSQYEAIVFGQAVIDIVQPTLTRLRDEYAKSINAIEIDYLKSTREVGDRWYNAPLAFHPTIYDNFRNREDFNLETFLNISSDIVRVSIYMMSDDGRYLRTNGEISSR